MLAARMIMFPFLILNSSFFLMSKVSSAGYGSAATPPPATGGTTFPTSNNGCLPIALPNGTVTGDPIKSVGKFFEYRSRVAFQQSYNAGFTNALVGDGLVYEPGTTSKAVHFTQKYIYVNQVNGAFQCHGGPSNIIARYDGVSSYLYFDVDSAPNVPIPSIYFYLYDDQSAQEFNIQYTCDKRNEISGKCDVPEIYVNTREDPSQMSADRMSAIDAIIDRVLKPYCLSKNDLQLVKHDSRVISDCPQDQVQQAFSGLVVAFKTYVPKRTLA
ncbi:hypothetical protein RvY_08431 [Ramazzottius varieornatus]|uniref:Uncharacterized protein n=1 Tax=Ramazzottius varieornatus TaxID=947166 RepID=A0A1D1VAF5_RAMVA|nr:hypothetical protein RvY_08431 [Ramazzottius varieornatus]